LLPYQVIPLFIEYHCSDQVIQSCTSILGIKYIVN